jgi:hypothetical protein
MLDVNVIKTTKKLIKKFRNEQTNILGNIPKLSEKLGEVCSRIERSWSGSFAGWHGNMYYRNFQIPSIHERVSGEWGGVKGIPDGWEEKQPEEVRVKIEELVGDNFLAEKFEDGIKKLREEAKRFKNEIIITFSSVNFDSNTAKEKDLFTQIENFKFGITKEEYFKDRLPKSMMSRDTEALRQGICLASWLYYEGVALEGKNIYEAINNFFALLDRLIRRLEMKIKSDIVPEVLRRPVMPLEPPIEIKESLERFKNKYPDSTKVAFIMMQFGKTKAHDGIVKAIRKVLGSYDISGVKADDKQYHDDLFHNVTTYLYGCGFGIAVFERIESEEFNPNVSLEVGYMLALKKPVCLLKDKTLKKLNTDLVGKLNKFFDPQDPIKTIPNEITQWLSDKEII